MLWALLILAFALAAVSIFVAFRFGGVPERAGGAILAMMLIAPRVIHFFDPKVFVGIDPAAFGTDLLALGGFVAIALKTWRYWPLWVSALQLLSVAAHLIRWFDIQVEPLVYAAMSGAPSYLISLTLIGVSLRHWYRRTRSAGQ